MGWFKRLKEGITTSTKEKKETPEGLWYKCPSCKKIHTVQDHAAYKYVCIELLIINTIPNIPNNHL